MENFIDFIQDMMARQVFPGAEFAVLDGEATTRYVVGDARLWPYREKLREGRLWDLASVSKVVGVGTVLIDRIFSGQLLLDASLQSLYPSWHEPSVTVRQLLTHTSGIDPFIAGRNQMDAAELTTAIAHLSVGQDKHFHYTDVNFILLGFMLEVLDDQPLDAILQTQLFTPWQLTETSFGPVSADRAVPEYFSAPVGQVHDPKAAVLGRHCGSAGLFSSLSDLIRFVRRYFADEGYLRLLKNYNEQEMDTTRSLAWGLLPGNWLLHTGYTGTFILMQLERKQAIVFLSNRVHLKDEREKWVSERDALIQIFIKNFQKF